MKPSSIVDDYAASVFDQTAYTRKDLQKAWSVSKDVIDERIEINLANGAWEQVFKKVGHASVVAYRRAKKKH